MNRLFKTVVLAAAGSRLWAGEATRGERYTVTACMENLSSDTLNYASDLVSRIYSAIGVHIDWRRMRNCPAGAIRITIQKFTSRDERPHALGYALPYDGTHIVVFYDRIQRQQQRLVSALTAHVIAHEIGHLLEGVIHHSDDGLMKAQWDLSDFSQMALRTLPFSAEDVLLIRSGLKRRSSLLAKANKPPVILSGGAL
jgi:hypothetical protein